jgi:hypothetical protein
MSSVDEFKVMTGTVDAQYGRTGGGVINLTIKSGTNSLHGSGFEFLKRTELNANTFSNNAKGKPRQGTTLDQYGLTLGGPVLLPKIYNGKDRTFFFFGWEGYGEEVYYPDESISSVFTSPARIWAEAEHSAQSCCGQCLAPGAFHNSMARLERPCLLSAAPRLIAAVIWLGSAFSALSYSDMASRSIERRSYSVELFQRHPDRRWRIRGAERRMERCGQSCQYRAGTAKGFRVRKGGISDCEHEPAVKHVLEQIRILGSAAADTGQFRVPVDTSPELRRHR